jgi:hypothetical protein
VYPPSFNAEVVCLWQKVNHLVDLLARAASVKKITFIYKPLHGRNWVSNGQGIDTMNLLDWRYPRWEGTVLKMNLKRGVYDHEAVLLPLCRLRSIQAIELIPAWDPSGDKALGLDNRLHRFVSLYLPEMPRDDLSEEQRVIAEERIDLLLRFISEINSRYHHALSDLISKSGDLLIVEKRFLPWNKFKKLEGQSNEATEQKYGKSTTWLWPTSILGE